ncbi:MAG: hypothetical protein HY673_13790 [Chloroflexi bacterium]|nr:hypothetical protein [Chloroflexota bacterium]
MTTYLVETSTFSHMMRQDKKLSGRIGSLMGSDRLFTCPIVTGEIMFGISELPEGQRRRNLEAKANALFEALASMDISTATAKHC